MGIFELYTAAALIYASVPVFPALMMRKRVSAQYSDDSPRTFAVIIPAYGEGTCLVDNVQAIIDQKAVNTHDIIVICDHCTRDIESHLASLGVTVLSRRYEQSTKVRALKDALEYIHFGCDTVVILDADNIVQPGFFEGISRAMADGTQIVQGERVAKNCDTPFAAMDAMSELYNNMIYRWTRSQFGLSASIIGSGFAMDRDLFDAVIPQLTAVGGFDKEMESLLVLNNIHIGYTESASVLDEKVREGAAFQNQRRRWIAAQLFYLRTRGFDLLKSFVTTGNINALDRFCQLFFPPRSILLLFWGICLLISLAFQTLIPTVVWCGLGALYASSLIAVLVRKHADKTLWYSLLSVPQFLVRMVLASLKLRGANATFIHTVHH